MLAEINFKNIRERANLELNNYELALKESKLELACDYLATALRLRKLYAYNLSYQHNRDERADAYREAAKLACMIYDRKRAECLLSMAEGLTLSGSSYFMDAANKMLPKYNGAFINILMDRLDKKLVTPVKIGDTFLLNNINCYLAGSSASLYIGLDSIVCLSKLDKDYSMYYSFYVIGAKKIIKESARFLRNYGFMIS